MRSRAQVGGESDSQDQRRFAATVTDHVVTELDAIALLCVLFAWPPEEPERPQHRWIPR